MKHVPEIAAGFLALVSAPISGLCVIVLKEDVQHNTRLCSCVLEILFAFSLQTD